MKKIKTPQVPVKFPGSYKKVHFQEIFTSSKLLLIMSMV